MPTEIDAQASPAIPSLDVQGTARALKPQRIPALDFTKGALVLVMVLYHWMNYFLRLSWTYYKYLHFLTPSFIFIAGFMISNVYLSKYAATDPRLSKRLLTRGLKLLAVFFVLNLARTLVVPIFGTGATVRNAVDFRNAFAVFVSGNVPVAGGKLVAFPILVPISYLLMLSGALMFPYRFYKYTFHVVCVLLLLAVAIRGLTGAPSPNLECITIGMMGVLTGFAPISAISDFIRHPYALAFAYFCYTIAITVWNIPFPLLIVGVYLSVMVIYLVGASGSKFGSIRSEFILLGKYSLFGYISQIAILQLLGAGFRRANFGLAALAASFFVAIALTIVSVEVVDRARARMPGIDSLYKAVFA